MLVNKISFNVLTPRSTSPVGVCIYGVPYIYFYLMVFTEFFELPTRESGCFIHSNRFRYAVHVCVLFPEFNRCLAFC